MVVEYFVLRLYIEFLIFLHFLIKYARVSMISDSFKLNEDDLISLSPEQWFNDNIINYYLQLIQAKDSKRIKCFGTFFFIKLKEEGLYGVLKWTWVRNPLNKHFSFYLIPMHLVNH